MRKLLNKIICWLIGHEWNYSEYDLGSYCNRCKKDLYDSFKTK